MKCWEEQAPPAPTVEDPCKGRCDYDACNKDEDFIKKPVCIDCMKCYEEKAPKAPTAPSAPTAPTASTVCPPEKPIKCSDGKCVLTDTECIADATGTKTDATGAQGGTGSATKKAK
jgi:hypothetical protein